MTTNDTREGLATLEQVDFDWTARLQQVWTDAAWDVPELHRNERDEFARRLQQLGADQRTQSPLGWILLGSGGAGKTHLLSAFRQEALRQDAGFVLVDMTDVRNFWDTVLQGYIDSLQTSYGNDFQYKRLLANFINRLGPKQQISKVMALLARRKSSDLRRDIKTVISALHTRYRQETLQYQNTVRALVCLNSDDWEISSLGLTFLQGLEIEESSRKQFGFTALQESPMQLVRALSWLMSLCGPTVLAFDQLDPLVQQLGYRLQADEVSEASYVGKSILEEIGGGLRALLSMTRRTLMVVSCVTSSWDLLTKFTLASDRAAFEPKRVLSAINARRVAEAIIRERLAPAFEATGIDAPYPTWPFTPTAIEQLVNSTPRGILQKCEQHRLACLRDGHVEELQTFASAKVKPSVSAQDVEDDLRVLDDHFAQARSKVDIEALLDPKQEVQLGMLLGSLLRCYLHELELPESVDAVLDVDFSGGKTTKPLHARLRLVFIEEDSREEHFCVRALEHTHARAYQARLKSAMTQAGIDQKLEFRHLAIVRQSPVPGGDKSQKLTAKFTRAGGKFIQPSEDELRTLHGLHELRQAGHVQLDAWLRSRKPASSLNLLQAIVPPSSLASVEALPGKGEFDLFAAGTSPTSPGGSHALDELELLFSEPDSPAGETPMVHASDTTTAAQSKPDGPTASSKVRADSTNPEKPVVHASGESTGLPAEPAKSVTPKAEAEEQTGSEPISAELPLGHRLAGDRLLGPLQMPLEGLEKHTVVLAGAGSGKTVLLKRLVEEAALRGIPSILIDCANDLASLDEAWPEPPQGWFEGDAQRAEEYHRSTETIVWTPGRDDGNPLTLQPIPDLAALVDSPAELKVAIDMVRESLRQSLASGSSSKAKSKLGILNASLHYFAQQGLSGLNDFISLLQDLPSEAWLGVKNETKLAHEMSDDLKVQQSINPMLRTQGSPLDPLLLFGDDQPQAPTRISVINLVGLAGLETQRSFINQLAMLLFSWIKRNPNPPGRRLRGLLVIDEARDFVPSQKSTVCKESLTQLTAQARKYHLGIIFATQNAKDIDNKIMGNCSTQFYGKASSAASIDVIREQIKQRGGDGDDIPKLERGKFYAYNADLGLQAPVKLASPMCLSHHTPNPLDQTQILTKAASCRAKLDSREL